MMLLSNKPPSWTVWLLVPTALLLATACGSSLVYLRGEAPLAALPKPRIVVRVSETGGQLETWEGDLDLTGIVSRFQEGPPPGYGFRTDATSDGKEIILDVKTWTPGVPEIVGGQVLGLVYRPSGETILTLADEKGGLLYIFDGADTPAKPGKLPLVFSAMQKHAYYEALTTESLCRQVVAHLFMKVRSSRQGRELAPGETRIFRIGKHPYLAAVVDSTEIEESDCGDQQATRATFFWMRLPESADDEEMLK